MLDWRALSSEAAKPPQTAFACARAAEHVSQLVISIPALALSFLEVPLLSMWYRTETSLPRCTAVGRPTARPSFSSFGRRRTGVERASHKIGIPETFLGFCALGRSAAHWASQPDGEGEIRGAKEGGGRRRKEGREMGDR